VRYGVPAAAAIATVAGLWVMGPGPQQNETAAISAPTQTDASRSASGATSPAQPDSSNATIANAPTPAPPATTPVPGTAPPEPPAATLVPLARVGFAVTPWGEVYIDGRKTGITPPLREIALPPGRHTIEIRNSTFKPHRQTVDLAVDGSVRIKHKFE
jgi:serine/threonine-protein kinase